MKYIIVGLALICIILFIINLYDLRRYVVRQINISDTRVEKNVRICFVSDLHNFKVSDKFYEDIRVNKPDYILIGGDIITAKPGKNQTNAYEFLKKMSEICPDSVYMALGNHEYRAKIYPEVYDDMYPVLEKFLKEQNIKVLSNSSVVLDEGIKLSAAEIDRFYYKRFVVKHMDENYIESIVGKIDSSFYNILFAHNPDYFKNYNAYGSDLILSGHVHGGLIRLPLVGGVAHPGVRFFPKYSGGAYDNNGKAKRYVKSKVNDNDRIIRLIVSAGIGFHTLPLRLFNPGELIFVTINKK